MKTLKNYFLVAVVFCAFLMPGCQEEEFGTMKIPSERPIPDDVIANPEPIIPPSDVVREELAHATLYTMQWNDPGAHDWQLIGSFFNIDEGTFHSFNSLDNGDGETLANVDVNLLGGALYRQIIAPNQYPGLGQEENRRSTKFLPSDMSSKALMSIAHGDNPGLVFEEEFETHPNLPKSLQPHDYENPGAYLVYESGEVYLGRTDELNGNAPKYFAIRVMDTPDPIILQVIVPKNNGLIWLE